MASSDLDRRVKKLWDDAVRGRAWYDQKVVVLIWPGRPEDKAKMLDHFSVRVFGTHLEHGIWDASQDAGYSCQVASRRTLLFDVTAATAPPDSSLGRAASAGRATTPQA